MASSVVTASSPPATPADVPSPFRPACLPPSSSDAEPVSDAFSARVETPSERVASSERVELIRLRVPVPRDEVLRDAPRSASVFTPAPCPVRAADDSLAGGKNKSTGRPFLSGSASGCSAGSSISAALGMSAPSPRPRPRRFSAMGVSFPFATYRRHGLLFVKSRQNGLPLLGGQPWALAPLRYFRRSFQVRQGPAGRRIVGHYRLLVARCLRNTH